MSRGGSRAATRAGAATRAAPTLALVIALGLALFIHSASLVLAQDDLAWLRGEWSTVFDSYRYVPRLVFLALHTLFGPSAAAALSLIFLCHTLNTLFVYHLGRRLCQDRLTGLVAAAVFAINPVTLNTLTWISCLSYVLGTSLALLAWSAFLKANEPNGSRPLLWCFSALVSFGVGLLSSHDLFFLPVLFLAMGWIEQRLHRGLALCAVGMSLALGLNQFVYGFSRYGVDASRLLSLDFALAYGSSALSSGVALGLAYPLSFLAKTAGFLRACFAEPVRWGITVAVLVMAISLWEIKRSRQRPAPWTGAPPCAPSAHEAPLPVSSEGCPPEHGRTAVRPLRIREGGGSPCRMVIGLTASYVALITPYLIRLYLTPANVNYHISYVLTGRVFYLPFSILALAWGRLASALLNVGRLGNPPYRGAASPAGGERRSSWAWLMVMLPLLAYANAFRLYDRSDFLGLNVAKGLATPMPPRWNPYSHQHPAWLLVAALVVATTLLARLSLARLVRNRRRTTLTRRHKDTGAQRP